MRPAVLLVLLALCGLLAPSAVAADESTSGAKHGKGGVSAFDVPYAESKDWTEYK